MKRIASFLSSLSIQRITAPCLCLMLVLICLFSFQKQLTPTSGIVSSRKLPIYCVNTESPKVAISFDAAWGNEQTETLLSILEKDDVKAIAAAGHDLGNHSENHKQMSTLSADECKQEIQKVHDKVKELTGQDMILFRPPYGDYNDTLINTANSLGYHVIQWDIDSLDWKDYGADNIVSRVVDNDHLGNGSIILMHNGAKYTPDALERVITGLQEKGYEIVPISQLIYKENYEMDHEGRQFIKGNAK